MSKGVERTIKMSCVSIFINLCIALVKLIFGVFSYSVFLVINSFYNIGIAVAKYIAISGYHESKKRTNEDYPQGYGFIEYDTYYRVGVILFAISIIYIMYSTRLFIYGSNATYSNFMAIGIAAMTFGEITYAIYGIISMRKLNSYSLIAIKMTNLSSSIISLVLTQTAILSFTNPNKDHSIGIGLAGILLGFCVMLIGIYMIKKINRMKKSRNNIKT